MYSNIFSATVRKPSHVDVDRLRNFGHYINNCLPKYIQQVQLTAGDELELLIAPDGIIPTFTFLKDHHNTQFVNLSDITALDVPSRQYRFEVNLLYMCVCVYACVCICICVYIYIYIYIYINLNIFYIDVQL